MLLKLGNIVFIRIKARLVDYSTSGVGYLEQDVISRCKCCYSTTIPTHLVPSINMRGRSASKGCKYSPLEVSTKTQGKKCAKPNKIHQTLFLYQFSKQCQCQWFSMIQHTFPTLLHSIACCHTLLHSIVLYCTLLHFIVLCCTLATF